MTDIALTWLSTIAWLIATAVLFVLLARWSAGLTSWSILPGVVRGVRDWVAGEHEGPVSGSSSSSTLAAISIPHAWPTRPLAEPDTDETAEIEDL